MRLFLIKIHKSQLHVTHITTVVWICTTWRKSQKNTLGAAAVTARWHRLNRRRRVWKTGESESGKWKVSFIKSVAVLRHAGRHRRMTLQKDCEETPIHSKYGLLQASHKVCFPVLYNVKWQPRTSSLIRIHNIFICVCMWERKCEYLKQ